MQSKDFKVDIRVDGSQIPGLSIIPHAQGDPFPGGHVYKVNLYGTKLGDVCNRKVGVYKKISNSEVDQLFSYIWYLFENNVRKSGSEYGYILNTIERIEIAKDFMIIEGICSPSISLVRGKALNGLVCGIDCYPKPIQTGEDYSLLFVVENTSLLDQEIPKPDLLTVVWDLRSGIINSGTIREETWMVLKAGKHAVYECKVKFTGKGQQRISASLRSKIRSESFEPLYSGLLELNVI